MARVRYGQAEEIKWNELSGSRKSTPLPIPFLHQHATVMIKRSGAIRRGLPHSEGASVNHIYGKSFVRLVAVSKSYGSGPSQLEVLNQVELALSQGQTTTRT